MPNDEAMNEWLRIVAHDLKSPITAVMGFLDMVENAGKLNEQQEIFLNRALGGMKRMERMVSSLLDISWLDANMPLELTEVNIPAMLYETMEMLTAMSEPRSITVRIVVDEGLNAVKADARRLTQVFDNLISNAIKYNRDGGQVDVTVTREADHIQVAVRDTGIGIPFEDQSRIFERFFRSRISLKNKIAGSGLGLALTQGVVLKHRGRIWFESVPDEGTTFYFTLPLLGEEGEGDDTSGESVQSMGEGPEEPVAREADLASEETDVVDDAIQEKHEVNHIESTTDEVE